MVAQGDNKELGIKKNKEISDEMIAFFKDTSNVENEIFEDGSLEYILSSLYRIDRYNKEGLKEASEKFKISKVLRLGDASQVKELLEQNNIIDSDTLGQIEYNKELKKENLSDEELEVFQLLKDQIAKNNTHSFFSSNFLERHPCEQVKDLFKNDYDSMPDLETLYDDSYTGSENPMNRVD